jgi:drug/metabolite transporter (DMT)-like permease
MINIIIIILMLISTVSGAFGLLFFKKGAKDFNLNILKQLRNTNLIIGVLLIGAGTFFYLLALRKGSLSIVYSLNSLTYIWVPLISKKFLGEKINKYKLAGLILIMLGIFLITYFAA